MNITRTPTPTTPGVYSAHRDGRSFLVQLDDRMNWWPYPYMFSGWRTSELEIMTLVPEPDLEVDVPEIYNPETRERLADLTARIQAIPGADQEAAAALARELVLEEGW